MKVLIALAFCLACLFGSCRNAPSGPGDANTPPDANTPGDANTPTDANALDDANALADAGASTPLIQPTDLEYVGAFGLPGGSNGTSWEWGGNAMACCPKGDPQGPEDGFGGSIFGTGHDWYQQISEISIPVPVVSPTKKLSDLNTATTLQGFQDIRGRLGVGQMELPRAGMAYLPPQGAQTTDKLHFCWGEHYQEAQVVSHGWCELDLSRPKAAGGWYLGDLANYSTNDYMFTIPEAWATANTPGKLLATGRFRDGGWSGQGPSLFAYGPWNHGNPPAARTRLAATPLLLYSTSSYDEPVDRKMNGYHHADEWSGGAWLTAGDRSAVIFVGTKGTGECWYGFANGVRWPENPPYPPVPPPPNDQRGWWSTGFEGQFVFYNPGHLAAVAKGTLKRYAPQPYASLNVDEHLFNVRSAQQKYHLGAASFDRTNGLLYVFEYRGDGDKPLVHVWRVT